MYGTLAEEKGVSLLRAKLDNVTLHGDANLLASALVNPIDNAVKFAASRVVVDVTGRTVPHLLPSRDDGAGLPPAEYEHLGKHFYRSDPSKAMAWVDQRQEHRRPACRHRLVFPMPRPGRVTVSPPGPKVKALRLAQHGARLRRDDRLKPAGHHALPQRIRSTRSWTMRAAGRRRLPTCPTPARIPSGAAPTC